MTDRIKKKLSAIYDELKKVNGLSNVNVLSEDDIQSILDLEDENNLAVFECINRDICLCVTHDSNFRDPLMPLSIFDKNEEVMIPQPFPEILERDVVSSSPNEKVHEYLKMKFNLDLQNEEATLLVGFNL